MPAAGIGIIIHPGCPIFTSKRREVFAERVTQDELLERGSGAEAQHTREHRPPIERAARSMM